MPPIAGTSTLLFPTVYTVFDATRTLVYAAIKTDAESGARHTEVVADADAELYCVEATLYLYERNSPENWGRFSNGDGTTTIVWGVAS